MIKKLVEEVVEVETTEETPVVETETVEGVLPVVETVEEVVAPVVETSSLGFLTNIRGKQVVSVEFGEVYVGVKDAEGTTYKLPREEYISLL